jgi:hypothetical protein
VGIEATGYRSAGRIPAPYKVNKTVRNDSEEIRAPRYLNTTVIGRCSIGSGSLISQGATVINHDTPDETAVFSGERGRLLFKRLERNVFADFFRDLY